ncbi:MAG: prepilin peptidase [Pseudomonadota bacterium]
MPPWFFYTFAGMIGAVLGSFANVCIVRMPRGRSIVRPSSHCPHCGHRLRWKENIPILSFILLQGRCRGCGRKISVRYPMVELICAALSMLTWWHFRHPLPYFIYLCLFVIPLVIITFIDLKHLIIPDEISISGIFVGAGAHIFLAGPGHREAAALDSLLGALAGSLALFLVALVYEKLKKQEGLGGGDIKLIAMLGAFFGWKAALFMLLFSSILGSIVGLLLIVILRKDMKYAMPFGPFLVAAGFVQLFVGERAISWYLNLFM